MNFVRALIVGPCGIDAPVRLTQDRRLKLVDRRLRLRADNSVFGQQERRSAVLRRRRIQEGLHNPDIGLLVGSAFSDRAADRLVGRVDAAEEARPVG